MNELEKIDGHVIYSEKHREFLEKLKVKNPKAYEELEFLEGYTTKTKKIKANDNYGEVMATPVNLLRGNCTKITSAINRHSYFLSLLKTKNLEAFTSLEFLEEYKGADEKIIAKDKYGLVLARPNSLLKGFIPMINSAVDAHEYFLSIVREKHGDLFDDLIFIDRYSGIENHLLAKNKYGELMVNPNCIMQGHYPQIESAVNKHSFFIMQLKEKNNTAYKELEFLEEYIGGNKKIIAMSKYGKVKVSPTKLLSGRLYDIRSAVNVQNYFLNMFKDVNLWAFESLTEIGDYVDAKKKIIVRNEFGYMSVTPNNLLSGESPSIRSAIDRASYFAKKAGKIHDYQYDYSMIDASKLNEKSTIICPRHGAFEQELTSHLCGTGCPKCSGEKLAVDRAKGTELFIEQANIVHNNFYSYDNVVYVNNKTNVLITCREHGDFLQNPKSHLNGFVCRECSKKMSKGERQCCKILSDMNIVYETQKTFDECVDKQKLAFDFYLPEQNFLIEIQGAQHYEPVEFFGGEKKFRDQCRKDIIKRNYCMDNIPLLEIPYWDFKNMENIITDFIKGLE